MRRIIWLAGLAAAALLAGCSSSTDNGLGSVPQVAITESARVALTAGAVPTDGITVTDAGTGATVTIPGGTVITLDASALDDVPAVTPDSIVVTLRPVGQITAGQDGDFLTNNGLTVATKIGALAVLPTIAQTSGDYTLTIPVLSTATGDVQIWHFDPDDAANSDGHLVALPNVGHWHPLGTGTIAGSKVIIQTNVFGQFIVTTTAAGSGNQAPTADLQATPSSGTAPLTVNFDASASADSDGTIASYDWDFEGDGTFDAHTTTPTTSHIYPADGTFNALLKVTDDQGGTGTATATVTVGAGTNTNPVINTLTPLTATTGVAQTFTLDATDDGTIADVAWDFDNDGTYETAGGTALTIAHTFATAGTQTIGVQVTDNEGNKSTKTFDIVVSDVNLSANPATGALNGSNELPVTFTTSVNPALTITKVEYDFGDGAGFVEETDADKLTTTHTYTAPNTYTAQVRVTPSTGTPITASTTVTVTAAGGTSPVITNVSPQTATAGAAQTFTLDATDDGTIADVAWDFDNDGTYETAGGTALTIVHTFAAAGTQTIGVQVTDNDGNKTTHTFDIVVSAAGSNQAPVANFNPIPDSSNPLLVNFDGSISSDPDGSITAWSWDFDNDGAEDSTGETVTHLFSQAGDYPVKLTVTDNGTPGLTNSKTITVHVTAP